MKLTKLTLVIAGMTIAGLSYGQSSVETKTEARKVAAGNKIEAKSHPINNNDGYMGESRKILSKLNVKQIPASLPKYKEGQTKEEYKAAIISWMKANKNLLNAEFKKKFEEKHGS